MEAEEIELEITPEDLEDDDGDIDGESDDELDMQGFDEVVPPGETISEFSTNISRWRMLNSR